MQRLDMLLVAKGICDTRTAAQKAIKEGRVSVVANGQQEVVKKPGIKFVEDVEIIYEAGTEDGFASRGALKLEGALNQFDISVAGAIAIDVGQSTGGFTDSLLQQGAAHVVGVDVGHDQLHPKLREDRRVSCYEGMNARDLPSSLLDHTQGRGFDIAVMDVSFISQTKIIPSLSPLIRQGGQLISLVKPQFEVGKANLGKGGIVKNTALFAQVESLIKQCCSDHNWQVNGFIPSPIKGGDGNQEFLLWAIKR